MTRIGNCWCQKPQLTGIPYDHLLDVCSFRRLDYTQYVSPYYTIQYTLTHGMVISVVMTINKIDQCTTVRSLGQIQQKSIKEREGRYTFQWLWMKWRIVSIDCQLEVKLIPIEHDLDYQRAYIFYYYIYHNNWISNVVVILISVFDTILEQCINRAYIWLYKTLF
jgi:hypothetical protein